MMNRIGLTGLIFFSLTTFLSAQIVKSTEVPEAPGVLQGSAPVIPLFQVGAQTVQSLGYNLESQASGMSYSTNSTNDALNTTAWFSIVFVDSRTGKPLYTETGTNPEVWSAHFKFNNFTARLNSDTVNHSLLEMTKPSWLAEVRGQGFRFGMMTQGGTEVEGGTSNDPVIRLSGADEVTNISATTDAAASDYILKSTPSSNSVSFFGKAKNSGILYAGYEVPNLATGYLSVLAQGNVATDMTVTEKQREQGWAAALNLKATPLGTASEANPLALNLSADAIKGFNFGNTADDDTRASNADGNTAGFGLGGQVDWWVGPNLVVSPKAAFDGRLNDQYTVSTRDSFQWETGGGLMFSFSEKKFVADEWNELSTIASTFINNKIQKYAYVQVLGMYSKATDFDLAFKFEEPDGLVGFDPNLGAMVEYRINDVAKTNDGTTTVWSATGRVSYDLMDHQLVPYLRWYANGSDWMTLGKTSTIKVRFGTQVSVLPGVGIEAAYLTPQLYADGNTKKDQGKVEIIAILSTETGRVMTPKTMNFTDWNLQ